MRTNAGLQLSEMTICDEQQGTAEDSSI
jgi:hypothetical protein